MKKLFKRVISGLSAAAMLATIVPVQSVFAEEIKSISLSFAEGTKPKQYWTAKDTHIDVAVPEGAGYEVKGVSIVQKDGWSFPEVEENTANGKTVWVAVDIKPTDGNTFGGGIEKEDITLDGKAAYSTLYDGNFTAYFEIDALPTVKVQATDGIVYADGWSRREDTCYQLAGEKVTLEFPMDETKEFYGWAYLDPEKMSYVIPTEDKVQIDNYESSTTNVTVGNQTMRFRAVFTEIEPPPPDAKEIEKVVVDFTTPTNGDPVNDPDIKVDEEAPYSIDKAVFTESTTDLTAIKGDFGYGTYYMGLIVKAKEGYIFTENTEISVSGVTASIINNFTSSTMQIAAQFNTKGKPVKEINVTADLPVAGTKGDSSVTLNVAEGEPYTVNKVSLLDKDLKTFTDPMVEGEDYYISAELKVVSGYAFSKELTAKFNGEPWNIEQEIREKTYSAYYHFVCGSAPVPVTLIKDTALTFTPPTEGAKGEDTPQVTIPEGQGYTLTETTFRKKSNNRPFNGLLTNRTDYYVQVVLSKEAGYEFDSSVPVTLNGEEPDLLSFTPTKVTANFIFRFEYDDRQAIENVDVSFELPRVDDPIVNNLEFVLPDDAQYEVIDHAISSEVDTELEKYIRNKDYIAAITLKAKDGYKFDANTSIKVNGDKISRNELLDDGDTLITKYIYIPKYVELIESVGPELFIIPDVGTKGDATPEFYKDDVFSTTALIYRLDDSYFTENGKRFDGAMEAGKEYEANFRFTKYLSHEFTKDTTATIRVEYSDTMTDDIMEYAVNADIIEQTSEYLTVSVKFKPDARKHIDSIEINYETPVAGTTFDVTPNATVKFSDDEGIEDYYLKYHVHGANQPYMAYGNKYELGLHLKLADNYKFPYDVKVKVNGKDIALRKPYDSVGFYLETDLYASDDDAWFGCLYNESYFGIDFTPEVNVIHELDLKWDKPKAGDKYDVLSTAVPVIPENYKIDARMSYINYGNFAKGVSSNGFTGFVDEFENGTFYYLALDLTTEENSGYEFAEDCVVKINGNEPTYVWNKMSGRYYNANYLFSCDDITPKMIDTTEFTFTAPKIGSKVSEFGNCIVPKNDTYDVYMYTIKNGDDFYGIMKNDNGEYTSYSEDQKDFTFVEGETYEVALEISTKDGYLFTEDMKMLLNGEEIKPQDSSITYGYDPCNQNYKFSFTVVPESIDEISLTEEIPEAGTKGNSKPSVKLGDGVHYTLESASYLDKTLSEFTANIKEDKTYYIKAVLVPEAGYSFDKNAAVKVNGEAPFKTDIKDKSATVILEFEIPKKNTEKKTIYIDIDVGDDKISVERMPFEEGMVTLPSCPVDAPDGKEFDCWDVNGKRLAPGEKVELHQDTTIKAVWKDKDIKPSYKLGDVDLNGTTDIEDAVKVINHINGLSLLTGDNAKAADCNRDGKIDIEDAVMIINQINGQKLIPQD